MANRYVNAAASLTTTSSTTIYTVPGGCSALVQSIVIANEDSVTRTATAEFYDASATSTFTLIKDAGVPTASSLNMIDRPFVLEAGDQIRITAGTANVMDVLASIMLVDESTSVPVGLVTTAALADEAVTSAKLDASLSVIVVCTSSTRPSSPSEGQRIYETDTDREYLWNGASWLPAGTFGTWSTWTPTLTQNVTTFTHTPPYGRYTQTGSIVHATFTTSIASGTGTAGHAVRCTLPVTASGGAPLRVGSGHIYDASTGVRYTGMCEFDSTTTFRWVGDWAGTNQWGVTPSIAATTSDQFSASITYEAA